MSEAFGQPKNTCHYSEPLQRMEESTYLTDTDSHEFGISETYN